jgi:F0F1-type ATP synthase beta subunit
LSEQQRSRLAAIAAEQAALSGRQEALRAEVGQLAAAARLEQPAAGSLAALQQLVEGADEVEAAAAAELLKKLRRVSLSWSVYACCVHPAVSLLLGMT